MKKILSILLLFMLTVNCMTSHATNEAYYQAGATAVIYSQDSIFVTGKLLNRNYMIGGNSITEKELFSMLSTDADYRKICHQTKFLSSVAYSFSLWGGYCLGWGLSQCMTGNDNYKRNFIIGGSSLAIGAGFMVWSRCHFEKAISLYNEKLSHQTSSSELSVNVGFTPSGGLGVMLSF